MTAENGILPTVAANHEALQKVGLGGLSWAPEGAVSL